MLLWGLGLIIVMPVIWGRLNHLRRTSGAVDEAVRGSGLCKVV